MQFCVKRPKDEKILLQSVKAYGIFVFGKLITMAVTGNAGKTKKRET